MQELSAGVETVEIETRNLPSGVYAVTVKGRAGAAMLGIVR